MLTDSISSQDILLKYPDFSGESDVIRDKNNYLTSAKWEMPIGNDVFQGISDYIYV